MNVHTASRGGPSEGSYCGWSQPVKSWKSPLKGNLRQKGQYWAHNEAELLWWGGRGCSLPPHPRPHHPPQCPRDSSVEAQVPWHPRENDRFHFMQYRTRKVGTNSPSRPRAVGRIRPRARVSLFLVHSHFRSLLRTLMSYALQDRHFLRRTQSLGPCCSLCLASPSSLPADGGHTLRQPPEIPKS